jgi:hypothetical protein
MENFSSITAKSFVGKKVNLHLKDGSVIVNVQLKKLHKFSGRNNNLIQYALEKKRGNKIPLKTIAYAERINVNIMEAFA